MNYLGSLLAILFLVTSCSLDDDSVKFRTEAVPIVSVEMPESFVYGEQYEIGVTYQRPSTCYSFYNIFLDSEGNQRTVVAVNSVRIGDNCTELEDELVEVSFDFKVIYTDTYVFKFWQGKDDNDNDLYYIVEVPVVD